MRVLVSGSQGLIGTALVSALETRGDAVVRLVRRAPRSPGEASWDPDAGRIDPASLSGVDAAVHLGGVSVAARWTASRMARIRDSRVRSTRLLAEALTGLARPPRVLVAASATGYYGDRGTEVLTEESAPGSGFLAAVCREWEAAADPARRAGVRVVHLRTGGVLAREGGLLPRLLPVFRLGLGGPIGPGTQVVPWIALDDAVGAVLHLLGDGAPAGPVNIVSPRSVSNREFVRAIARAVRRPAVLPVPAVALRLLFGAMADEVLLASQRVEPVRLRASGYAFRFPDLDAALRHVLAGR